MSYLCVSSNSMEEQQHIIIWKNLSTDDDDAIQSLFKHNISSDRTYINLIIT